MQGILTGVEGQEEEEQEEREQNAQAVKTQTKKPEAMKA